MNLPILLDVLVLSALAISYLASRWRKFQERLASNATLLLAALCCSFGPHKLPTPPGLFSTFRWLYTRLAGSALFTGDRFVLSLVTMAIVGVSPAMGQPIEVAATTPTLIAFIIAIQFLVVILLYEGVKNTISLGYVSQPYSHIFSLDAPPTRNIYEVDPPRPRSLLA
jgi:hypothetical protein